MGDSVAKGPVNSRFISRFLTAPRGFGQRQLYYVDVEAKTLKRRRPELKTSSHLTLDSPKECPHPRVGFGEVALLAQSEPRDVRIKAAPNVLCEWNESIGGQRELSMPRVYQHIDAEAVPLDLTGYGEASLLLSWSFSSETGEAEMIFACVELLAQEIPAPETKLLLDAEKRRSSGRCVWLGQVKMPASEALQWYTHAIEGDWTVPPELAIRIREGESPRYRPLGEGLLEPAWPSLNLLRSTPANLSFIPIDLECPRVHHRLTRAPASESWTPEDRRDVSEILRSMLHVSLINFPSLWGSAHLVAHNPVLRSVGLRIVARESSEDLAVTLIPRRSASLAELSVSVWELRNEAAQHLASFRGRSPVTLLSLTGEREAVALSVDSDIHGRIYDSNPVHFIKSIHLGMQVTGSRREVTVDRGSKGKHTFHVSTFSDGGNTVIGTSRPLNALMKMSREAEAQKAREALTAREEVWFDGDWDDAQDTLRSLVSRARRRVTLVDYFFSDQDVGLLIPAVASLDVEIRVLTSKEGLKRVGAGKDGFRAMAEKLERTVGSMVAKLRMQSVQVRYMTGTKAPIHDRFLVVDDRVYLLGSSLNEYGSRATMLVRLRYPDVVRPHIERQWNAAKRLVPSGEPGADGGEEL